jgi:predicted PurR-regulated permease PerM
MSSEQLVPLLMLFTIIAVLGIAVWQLMAFLSKRRNRIAAQHAFKGSEAPPDSQIR